LLSVAEMLVTSDECHVQMLGMHWLIGDATSQPPVLCRVAGNGTAA